MIQWLKRVIGMARNTTQPVMPALPTQTSPIGGNNNTAVQRKHQPAAQGSKAKPKPVKVATPARSRKTATSPVQTPTKKSKVAGTPQSTVAPRAALLKAKPKLSAAKPTKQAQSPKLGQKAALTTNGARGKQQATLVSKTRPHVKSKVKLKP